MDKPNNKLTIEPDNNADLTLWLNERMRLNHDFSAIKGPAPPGSTYEDGELITRPVNIGWKDEATGEVFKIKYLRGAR